MQMNSIHKKELIAYVGFIGLLAAARVQELFKVQEKSWARRPSHRNHGQDAHATRNFEQFLGQDLACL